MELNITTMESNNIEPFEEETMNQNSAYNRAEKRLIRIKGFYKHLMAYCLFTPFTIFVNYKTYWDYQWFWYSLIAWGIGLAIHAFNVFVPNGIFGSQWEARKIEQFLKEEKENKNNNLRS